MHSTASHSYAATACAVVQHAGTEKELIETIKAELQLEQAAGNARPLICIDRNNELQLTGLYIAIPDETRRTPTAPLGVCIRRYFASHNNFLWIENTSGQQDSPLWSAVLVKDGLAVEELLDGSKEDLIMLLSRVSGSPAQILTAHRAQLERWITNHLLPRQHLEWTELPASPLSKAMNFAKLEPAQNILRAFRNRKLKTRGAIIAVAALAFSVFGLFLFNKQLFIQELVEPPQPIPVQNIIGILGGDKPVVRLQAIDPYGQSKSIRVNIGHNIGYGDEQWQVTDIDLERGVTFKHLRTGKIVVLNTNKRPRLRER